MTSQARSRNENWLKFSVNVEYAWQLGKIFQDDEPPKSSWSLRKSTKSWDQLSVQRFTKVTQSHEERPSLAKKLSYRSSWRGSYALKFEDRTQEERGWQKRCASREETSVQSIWKLNEDGHAISLVFLIANLQENSWQILEHNAQVKPKTPKPGKNPIMLVTTKGKVQLGTTAVLLLETLRSLWIWIPEVDYHTSRRMGE